MNAQTVNIRIDKDIHQAIKDIAESKNMTLAAVMAEALEQYRRRWILDESAAAYARLKADPEAREREMAERRLWDNTLSDVSSGA